MIFYAKRHSFATRHIIKIASNHMHMYKMNFCPLIETQKFNTSSLWNLVVRIFYVLWITINHIMYNCMPFSPLCFIWRKSKKKTKKKTKKIVFISLKSHRTESLEVRGLKAQYLWRYLKRNSDRPLKISARKFESIKWRGI